MRLLKPENPANRTLPLAAANGRFEPSYRVSALRLMSAITVKVETFNNHLGFERGFWKR